MQIIPPTPTCGECKNDFEEIKKLELNLFNILTFCNLNMRAKFEEKSYEGYFNNELERRSSIYFPLGQVQEGNLGFDSTAFSKNRKLWRRIGYPFLFFPHYSGLELSEIAEEMEHFLGIEIDNIPTMKSNLLFQYKKPEYVTIKFGSEWKHWNRPYYRYDIYKEQQNLLMHIHTSLGSKVLVIYASPAVHDVNELVKIHKKKQLIDHSNFRRAAELNGHHRNTYIKAGSFSIACSEPKKIENFNLLAELESISKRNFEKVNDNNRKFIIDFSNEIIKLTKEYEYLSESFRILNESILNIEKFELLYSFLTMMNFRQLTGTQWLIKI